MARLPADYSWLEEDSIPDVPVNARPDDISLPEIEAPLPPPPTPALRPQTQPQAEPTLPPDYDWLTQPQPPEPVPTGTPRLPADYAWLEQGATPETTAPGPVVNRTPAQELNLFERIPAAFTQRMRGLSLELQAGWNLVQGMFSDQTEDLERLRTERAEYQRTYRDLGGNWLVGASAMLPDMMLSAAGRITGGKLGKAGGTAIGAVLGLGAGLAIPTVGEEPITTAAGAAAGEKLGGTLGAMLPVYMQGAGSLYYDMRNEGYSEQAARRAARLGGIPYAAIEMLNVFAPLSKLKTALGGAASPEIGRKVTRDVIKRFLAEPAKYVGKAALKEAAIGGLKEAGEEPLQRLSDNLTKEIAAVWSERAETPETAKPLLERLLKGTFDEFKAALGPSYVLALFGGGLNYKGEMGRLRSAVNVQQGLTNRGLTPDRALEVFNAENEQERLKLLQGSVAELQAAQRQPTPEDEALIENDLIPAVQGRLVRKGEEPPNIKAVAPPLVDETDPANPTLRPDAWNTLQMEAYAKATGRRVVWFKDLDGTGVRGTVTKDAIYINVDAGKGLTHLGTMLHEIMHRTREERPDEYRKLRSAFEASVVDLPRWENEIRDRWAAQGIKPSSQWDAIDELMAEFLAEEGKTSAFWQRLGQDAPAETQTFIANLLDVLDTLRATSPKPDAKLEGNLADLETIRGAVADYMRQAGTTPTQAQGQKPQSAAATPPTVPEAGGTSRIAQVEPPPVTTAPPPVTTTPAKAGEAVVAPETPTTGALVSLEGSSDPFVVVADTEDGFLLVRNEKTGGRSTVAANLVTLAARPGGETVTPPPGPTPARAASVAKREEVGPIFQEELPLQPQEEGKQPAEAAPKAAAAEAPSLRFRPPEVAVREKPKAAEKEEGRPLPKSAKRLTVLQESKQDNGTPLSNDDQVREEVKKRGVRLRADSEYRYNILPAYTTQSDMGRKASTPLDVLAEEFQGRGLLPTDPARSPEDILTEVLSEEPPSKREFTGLSMEEAETDAMLAEAARERRGQIGLSPESPREYTLASGRQVEAYEDIAGGKFVRVKGTDAWKELKPGSAISRQLAEQDASRPAEEAVGELPFATSRAVTPEVDREYMDAVERGDTATQERMVAEAAKRAGYTQEAWHASPAADITEFRDFTHVGTLAQTESLKEGRAKVLGKDGLRGMIRRTYHVFVKADAPLRVEDRHSNTPIDLLMQLNPSKAVAINDALRDASADIRRRADEKVEKEFRRDWKRNPGYPQRSDAKYRRILQDADAEWQNYLRGTFPAQARKALLDELGDSDSLVYLNRYEEAGADVGSPGTIEAVVKADSLIIPKSNQIKSADPITRDDQGRVIPLSERFNPNRPEIAFATSRASQDRQAAAEEEAELGLGPAPGQGEEWSRAWVSLTQNPAVGDALKKAIKEQVDPGYVPEGRKAADAIIDPAFEADGVLTTLAQIMGETTDIPRDFQLAAMQKGILAGSKAIDQAAAAGNKNLTQDLTDFFVAATQFLATRATETGRADALLQFYKTPGLNTQLGAEAYAKKMQTAANRERAKGSVAGQAAADGTLADDVDAAARTVTDEAYREALERTKFLDRLTTEQGTVIRRYINQAWSVLVRGKPEDRAARAKILMKGKEADLAALKTLLRKEPGAPLATEKTPPPVGKPLTEAEMQAIANGIVGAYAEFLASERVGNTSVEDFRQNLDRQIMAALPPNQQKQYVDIKDMADMMMGAKTGEIAGLKRQKAAPADEKAQVEGTTEGAQTELERWAASVGWTPREIDALNEAQWRSLQAAKIAWSMEAHPGRRTMTTRDKAAIREGRIKRQGLASVMISEAGTTVRRLATEHFSVQRAKLSELTAKLRAALPQIPEADAAKLAKALETAYWKLLSEKGAQMIEDRLTRQINPATKQPYKRLTLDDRRGLKRMLEAIRGGATTKDAIAETFGKLYGFKEMDQTTRETLAKFADHIAKAPAGVFRQEAERNLQAYVARKVGVETTAKYWSLWYASILSGAFYQTGQRNIVGTLMNTTSDILQTMLITPQAIPRVLQSMPRIWQQAVRQASQEMRTGVESTRQAGQEKYGQTGSLEMDPFTGGASFLNQTKIVGRALRGQDSFFFVLGKEAYAIKIATLIAAETGKTGIPLQEEVSKLLHDSPADLAAAEKQARQELGTETAGRRVTESDIQRRQFEIMEQARSAELDTHSRDFAARATYNFKMEGWLGVIGQSIQNAQAKIPQLKPLMPFVPIVFNVANTSLNYDPLIGTLRILRGIKQTGKDEGNRFYGGRQNMKELWQRGGDQYSDELARAWTKVVIGALTWTALGILAYRHDDEDDKQTKLRIYGAGPTDPREKEKLYAIGWKPYTIKIGENYYNYLLTPLAIPMAFWGSISDDHRYVKTEQKELLTRFALGFSRLVNAVDQMTFSQGLGQVMSILDEKDPQTQAQRAYAYFGRQATSFVPQLFKQVYRAIDPTVYDAKTVQEMVLKELPFVNAATLRPRLDMMGNVIAPERGVTYTSTKDSPLFQLLIEKDASLSRPDNMVRWPFPTADGKRQYMSPEERYEYIRRSGAYFRDMLTERADDIRRIPSEVPGAKEGFNPAAETIYKLLAAARKRAMYELWSERNTPDEK